MFERFDEQARRTLFYARYEASRLGSRSIENEHLLLGLIRESKGPAAKVLSGLPLVDIRKELESNRTHERVSESVEIPFSAPTKRVLAYASDEADRLAHRHIGTEHLLLGLMRDDSIPSAILARYGMRLDEARALVDKLSSAAASPAMVTANALAQIARIEKLTVDLENLLLGNTPEVAMRVGLLRMDLEALKSLLDDHQ